MRSDRNGFVMRGMLVIGSLLLCILNLVFPYEKEETVNWNDGGLKTESIAAGDVLVQPIAVEAAFDQLGVRIEAVRESKGLTFDMTLTKGDSIVAQQELPLKKVKAKGKVMLEFPTAEAGEYVLTIHVLGEGNTKLGAGEVQTMTLNGQEQAVGCAIRMNCVTKEYSYVMFFCALLLLMLAVVPSGNMGVKRHE
ncbi:MAG: hypothetical protein J6M20_04010 [Clostridia bacterium]|nr:hypothetical protein [Clostridia bacterium]